MVCWLCFCSYLLLPFVLADTNFVLERCDSTPCMEANSYLSRFMRPDVDPCVNFFEFVCGGLSHQISSANLDVEKQSEYVTNLRGNITQMLTDGDDSVEWLRKAKNFYRSCRRNRLQPDSFESFRMKLQEIFALKRWDLILGALRRHLSFSFLFVVSHSMGYHESIDINQADQLFIQSDIHRLQYRLPELWRQKHERASAKISLLINNTAPLLKELDLYPIDPELMIELESMFSEYMTPVGNKLSGWSRQLNRRRISFSNLRHKYLSKDWDWDNYLKHWEKDIDYKSGHYIVREPIYVQSAISLLHRLRPKFLFQYITLKLLEFVENNFFHYVPDRLMSGHNAFGLPSYMNKFSVSTERSMKISGKKIYNDAREGVDACLDSVIDTFPALSLQVLDQPSFISMDIRATIASIAFLIKEAFREQIGRAHWLSGHQRKIAKQKLQTIRILITYPQSQLRSSSLNSLFANLQMESHGNYIENVLEYLEFFGRLNLLPDYKEFVFTYWPFYARLINTVAIQGSFLQPANFNPNWPGYLLYGTVGHAIAHEMAHAFDRNGWYYDAYGNYIPRDKWQPTFRRFWFEKEDCFRNHYDSFYLPFGLSVNGDQTMGENIADVIGVQLAYRAYLMSEMHNKDDTLPGFTQKQLFFVSLGRTLAYCNHRSQEIILEEALMDTHTPGKYRLLGMLRNSPEFAQMFNCPVGSFMNPIDSKCNLFDEITS